MLAAASVFRDDAFARIYAFMGAALLACLALAAAATFAAAFGAAIPGYVLPLALGMAGGFAFLAAGAALFAVSSQASSENRRWTPALDSTMLIRKVTLLRREPYALPSAR